MKRVWWFPISVAVVGVAVLVFVDAHLANWANRPLPLEARTLFTVPAGASLRVIAGAVGEAGVVDAGRFRLRARQRNMATALHHGEYAAGPSDTADALLDRLARGEVVQHRFRIREGSTIAAELDTLRRDARLRFDLAEANAENLMSYLGLGDETEHAEGWFFPDTYLSPRDTSASDLLRRANARMREVLNVSWENRDRDGAVRLGSPKEALILASIIERETGHAADRPRIARVFLNRLHRNMRLQADPTVIYGLGAAFDGDLTRADLAHGSLYNTYRHRGLPPTPISLPGRASIQAALNPANGDELYFVARGDGTSEFSQDLRQHNAAVRRYQLRRVL